MVSRTDGEDMEDTYGIRAFSRTDGRRAGGMVVAGAGDGQFPKDEPKTATTFGQC